VVIGPCCGFPQRAAKAAPFDDDASLRSRLGGAWLSESGRVFGDGTNGAGDQPSCAQAKLPQPRLINKADTKADLARVVTGVVFRAVIRRLLSDRDVMWMILTHGSGGDFNELHVLTKFFNRPSTAISHASS
jgi:hypothetical protein